MKYIDDYTKEISFPLGGIGSGCIGLAGNGRLIDWEIFNRPSKGSANGLSHIAVKAIRGDKVITKVLNGDLKKDFTGQYGTEHRYGIGAGQHNMCGFPHFKNSEFYGEFPIAKLKFTDDNFPGEIMMTAFNPFIPGDEDNSSIPAAFFEIEIYNPTDEEIEYQTAFSVFNPFKTSRNDIQKVNNRSVLTLMNAGADKNDIEYGDLTLATDCDDFNIQRYWYRGNWCDAVVTFWNNFNTIGMLKDRVYDTSGNKDAGSVVARNIIAPKTSKKVRFVLSWNVPNNYNYWNECKDEEGKHKIWKNYYATLFENSAQSAVYSLDNWDNLYNRTINFKELLHGSTFSKSVTDAAASNLSVLKSPTVLRLEDGSLYGWEGLHEREGSCEGTCQHVWNYAYALCFLFPRLERSIRNMEFKYSTDRDGRMGFRIQLPIGRKMTDFRACVDGQMGAVIKTYREWKLSGDNEWLKGKWEDVKRVLEYAWSEENPDKWDRNKDGVLEGRQHHTLDMELFGPSSWLEGMYLAALKAAAEMGSFLGDEEKAEEYRGIFEKGKKWTKENLYNGKYFIQKIDLNDKSIIDNYNDWQNCDTGIIEDYWNDETGEIKYQIGDGSSIDQLLAQWHSDIIGLGDIFDSEQISNALDEMMKNNYKDSMREFVNPWRVFSLNDEAGSVICTYPENSQKPKIPIPYCEETMTGFEYSFAGLLFSRGKSADGEKVVKAVRDRFDGEKRNPWNEFECGANYARSMASYALIPILSGFEFDLPNKYIGFNPYKHEEFKTIWSVDGAWGSFVTDKNIIKLELSEGCINLSSLGLKFLKTISEVKIDGKNIDFEFKNGIIYFEEVNIYGSVEILK